MNSSAATGPCAMVCIPPFQRPRLGVRREVERHALPDQHEAAHQRQGQQDPKQAADQVHPEVAQRRRLLRAKPRMNAMPTASPAAPARKFCEARPSSWVR